ncbi:MAG TPA: hypothetical protein VJX66_30575 [Amycolatopsis sp.]|nr:hypothetical protein [Amycolatopsis sp.]
MRPNTFTPARRQILIGAVGLAAATLGGGQASASPGIGKYAPMKARFTLPSPTGVLPIGVTQVHLRQRGRADPWVPSVTRELMISLWYPARRSGDARRAPYLQSQLADYYVDSPPAGLPTGHIDWSATATNATPLAEALPRAGGYPVVLYSPGGGNSRALGTVLAEELASHGFVVVTVDHTHETAVAFPGGRLEVSAIPANPPDINAAKQLFMDSREADILFVLDQLNMIADGENPDADGTPLPAGLTGALNPAAMGMYGHSAGGVTAARAVRDDDRLLAGINMEGFFEFGENHPELGEHDPFLLMGARSNPDYPPLLGEPRTHRTDPLWQEFWSHCTGYRLDLNVPDGRHYTYTDLQWWLPQLAAQLGIGSDQVAGLIGTVEPGGIIAAERAYVTAFFEQTLRHRPQRLLAGPSPWFPQVRFIR